MSYNVYPKADDSITQSKSSILPRSVCDNKSYIIKNINLNIYYINNEPFLEITSGIFYINGYRVEVNKDSSFPIDISTPVTVPYYIYFKLNLEENTDNMVGEDEEGVYTGISVVYDTDRYKTNTSTSFYFLIGVLYYTNNRWYVEKLSSSAFRMNADKLKTEISDTNISSNNEAQEFGQWLSESFILDDGLIGE